MESSRHPVDWDWEFPGEDKGAVDAHHDPSLDIAAPGLKALADHIHEVIQASPEWRTARRDARHSRYLAVCNIIANLAQLAESESAETRIAISLRQRRLTRYDRLDLPVKALSGVIEAMESLGYLEASKGDQGKPIYGQPRRRTTIAPSPVLARDIQQALARPTDARPVIEQRWPTETIILRAGGGLGSQIDYEDTPESTGLRADMAVINAALHSADIRLGGKHHPRRRIYRIFRGETGGAPRFDRLGRLYGGFWINLPKADRHRITIDGEAVVVT
ncbi:hypothetical protein [Hoeflea sp. YIM 152468]|uniref:hypothetical protein n=1 Tax=Hoeflea sp. YIM 152468 TaxID=3031759 RepID=UPI0023DCE66F|nr:hypothetical protein [Hoeflea sp. YIM 152468]